MPQACVVLYAEDDENDAFFMERAFAKLKRLNSLRIVRDGAQAVDYLSGQGEFRDRTKYPFPTLVLLDVKLPRMSGLEVLAWLRSQASLAFVPVVMFTSSIQDSDVAQSREHRANAYLVKPSNAEHLAAQMGHLLRASKRLVSPSAALPIAGNQIKAAPPL